MAIALTLAVTVTRTAARPVAAVVMPAVEVEQRWDNSSSGSTFSSPSLQEVVNAIAGLRDTAAAGADNTVAGNSKPGNGALRNGYQWLRRVIVAVWVSRNAPIDWQRAMFVPLFKAVAGKRQSAYQFVQHCWQGVCILSCCTVSANSGQPAVRASVLSGAPGACQMPPTPCAPSCLSATGTSSRSNWRNRQCTHIIV